MYYVMVSSFYCQQEIDLILPQMTEHEWFEGTLSEMALRYIALMLDSLQN